MKNGYILLSAIGVLVLLGVVLMFVLKQISASSTLISMQKAKIKVELVMLASEAIVLNEIAGHDYKTSCLDKIDKSFSNGEVNAYYELIYSDDIGLCKGVFGAFGSTRGISVSVNATLSAKSTSTIIRKRKIFSLKI